MRQCANMTRLINVMVGMSEILADEYINSLTEKVLLWGLSVV